MWLGGAQVLLFSNLLPCAVRFSLWVDGAEAPLPSQEAHGGEDTPVHAVGLNRRVRRVRCRGEGALDVSRLCVQI